MSDDVLTNDEVDAAGLDDWRRIRSALHTRYRTGDFAAGLRLVQAIGEAAEAANHHPDLDLRYPHVNIRLFSHDRMGITQRDLDLATRISELAASLGVEASPGDVETIDLALDTPDHGRIKPFWRAVLAYRDHPDEDDEVRTDDADLPLLWFQASGDEAARQRFHLDVNVPKEVARSRIDAAVAAGGRVVDETPTFVVLADADGNRACVCF